MPQLGLGFVLWVPPVGSIPGQLALLVVSFRIGQERGRSGFYVYVSRPRHLRKLKGSNTTRKKGGDTEQEALKNALRIEAELLQTWEEQANPQTFRAAKTRSREAQIPFDEALEDQLREEGWKPRERERVLMSLQDPAQLQAQGLEPKLTRSEEIGIRSAESDQLTWMEWVSLRKLEEHTIAPSTIANWETKLRGLAEWFGSEQLGVMGRRDAHAYKLHMLNDKHMSGASIRNYIGAFSGMWNWAKTSGQLETENIWTGLKKGLDEGKSREALDPELLAAAEEKADKLEDVRFFFGRYQGLRKEDYCGLRWCDIDMQERVIHLRQYEWKGQIRRLKLKKKGERTIPIHSKLYKKLCQYLPEAKTRNDDEPCWPTDYKAKLASWGPRWAERFSDRYGFGSHDLRSYVVTQMMMSNINDYFLHQITGHTIPGASKVVRGYVAPTIEQVREVLELLA